LTIKEHRLRIFDGNVQRRSLGQMRDEIVAGCRKLYIENLHNLYCFPDKITSMKSRRKMGRSLARIGRKKCLLSFGVEGRSKDIINLADICGGMIL
jgi:hypothetical protein